MVPKGLLSRKSANKTSRRHKTMRRLHLNRLSFRMAAGGLLVLAVSFFLPSAARAQTQTPDSQNAPAGTAQPESIPQDPETIFPHPDSTRWWISGQFNSILQAHPTFHALYSGAHSLHAASETHDSRVLTLYTGLEVAHWTEILFDGESTGGRGLSDAFGLAGFTDLDVVRNPELGPTPYLARLMIHQIIPLSHETAAQDRGPLDLFTQLPVRRLEFRFGKMTLPDFFDINPVGSDDHLQFMNWTDANNGAYDYAADTRGYTWAAMLEYDDRSFAVRFAEALMPTVANGITLDWDVARARAENVEVEFHPGLLAGRPSAVRLLSFVNHANMGDYAEAIALFREGKTPVPVIEDTRRRGTVKYGFGVNLEQDLTSRWRAFSRFGWNEGQHESFVYTEVDET